MLSRVLSRAVRYRIHQTSTSSAWKKPAPTESGHLGSRDTGQTTGGQPLTAIAGSVKTGLDRSLRSAGCGYADETRIPMAAAAAARGCTLHCVSTGSVCPWNSPIPTPSDTRNAE